MSTQRHSCDRCRQQKVRCLKDWGLQTNTSNGDHLTACERCTKANAPCVYSLRPRTKRISSRPKDNSNGSLHFNDDLAMVLSRDGVSETDLNNLSIPMLDVIPDLDDTEFQVWNTNHNLSIASMPIDPSISMDDHMNNEDCDVVTVQSSDFSSSVSQDGKTRNVDGLIDQLIAVSTRATRATRSLERSEHTCSSLTVNSPAVSEAFEAANSLVHIINSIPQVNTIPPSAQLTPPQDFEPLSPDYGLVFMAFASHQHVLALFKAICDSIRRSVGTNDPSNDIDRQVLSGDEASSAQFVMVLQLVMHMINRIGRSLRMSKRSSTNDISHDHISSINPQELAFTFDGGKETRDLQGIVDVAQDMLRTLPDEHTKLKQVIQSLQTCIEERLHI